MQLMEALGRLSSEQIARMARAHSVQSRHERAETERVLAELLTDRASLQRLIAELPDEEWAALKVVFFNGAEQGITVELCHQIVNLLSGRRRRSSIKAVEDLQDRGLIYLRAQNYRQVFFIPHDLFAVLGEIMNERMIARVCLPAEALLRPSPTDRDLMEDLHRFLAYLSRNEVTLTQQGTIFKRHLRALIDLLVTGDTDEESLVGRYPEPLGLLVGYALDRQLIRRHDGVLAPSDDLMDWLDRPVGEKRADLFAYWQNRYFYQDLQTFLAVSRTVGLEWVSVGQLTAETEPLINPSQRGSFLLRLNHHLTGFLAPMGIFELAQTGTLAEPDLACRLTAIGHAILLESPIPDEPNTPPAPLVLQATYEIIAPRPVPPKVLWGLELAADLVRRTDRTLTYRLTKQSVYRALKAGKTGEELLAFLTAHSTTGVPQNVAFDLRAWTQSYGQVYLQAVTLLRCADHLLAEQVKASRRTGRFILGEISPVDLIVNTENIKALLDGLEADGLMPRPDLLRV